LTEQKQLNPLRGFIRGLWAFAFLCLAVPAGLAAAGVESEAPFIVGIILGCISLMMLPLFYYLGRRYRREAAALLGGQHLVYWTYQRQEWEQFLHSEWAVAKRRMVKASLYLSGAGAVGGILPTWGTEDWVTGLIIAAVAVVLLGGLIPGLVLLSQYNIMQQGLRGQAEAWVGLTGAYLCSRYIPWGAPPRSVKLTPGFPAVLRFELHGKSSLDGPPTVRIPVPNGCEEQAAVLAGRFGQHG